MLSPREKRIAPQDISHERDASRYHFHFSGMSPCTDLWAHVGFISTNESLSSKEVLSIYEDRWDIETAHRETNQKLGFKDYQLKDKQSIERFIQLVFSVWAAILFWEMDNPQSEDGSNPRTMGDMIDRVKMQAVGETFEYVMRYFNLPVPDGGLLYILKSLGMKM